MQSSGSLSFAKCITLAVAAASSFAWVGVAGAAQLVEPYDAPTGGTELTSINRYGGQTVQFYGRYSATGSQNGQESGLGLKVKYDKTKFTTVVIDQVMMKCSIASSPGFDQQETVPATSQAVFGWIDTSIRAAGAVGWPADVDVTDPNGCLEITGVTEDDAAKTLPLNLFRFTGTLIPGFGVGSSTNVQLVSEGNISYAHTGNTDINKTIAVTGVVTPPISLAAVNPFVSRRNHGAAGDFDIVIDPAGVTTGTGAASGVTIEPRHSLTGVVGAPATVGHKVIMNFTGAQPTSASSIVAVTQTNAPITSTADYSQAGQIVITLGAVPNGSRVRVTANAVNGEGSLNPSVVIGYLLGDVTGTTKAVNPTDSATTRGQNLQPVTSTNFRNDVNLSGTINPTDAAIVRGQNLQTLQ